MAKFEQKSEWAGEKHESVKRLLDIREDAKNFFVELRARCISDAGIVGGRVCVELDGASETGFYIVAPPFRMKVTRQAQGGITTEFYNDAVLEKTENYIPVNVNGDLGYQFGSKALAYKDMSEELLMKVLDADASLA